MVPNEISVDRGSVPGHVTRAVTAEGQHLVQGGGPLRRLGVGPDSRFGGLLHQVAAEHHRRLTRNHDNEIVVGMPRPGMADPDLSITKVEIGMPDQVLWWADCPSGLRHLIGISPESQRFGAYRVEPVAQRCANRRR